MNLPAERSKPTTDTPFDTHKILTKGDNQTKKDENFKYSSMVGNHLYLGKEKHTDLSYSVHQCVRCSEKPLCGNKVNRTKSPRKKIQGCILEPIYGKRNSDTGS